MPVEGSVRRTSDGWLSATPGRPKNTSSSSSYVAADSVACKEADELYYYGIVPPAPESLSRYGERLTHHLAIILTSRIAGAYLRDAGITYPINDGVELRRTRR